MASRIDITGTRAALAAMLTDLLFGPVTWLLSVVLLGGLLAFAETTQHWIGTGVLAALLLVVLLFLRRFIVTRLGDEAYLAATARTERERLPFDLVAGLPSFTHVSTADLLRASLAADRGRFLIRQMAAKRAVVWECLRETAENLDVSTFLAQAASRLPEFNKKMISAPFILYLLFEQSPAAIELLNGLDLSLADLREMLKWEKFHELLPKRHAFWSPHVLIRAFGGLEKSWMLGYTGELDRLTSEVTNTILWKDNGAVILHEPLIGEALQILARQTNHNILVVGPQGVGKTAFIENLLYRLRRSEVKESRATTRVLLLRTAELLSSGARPDTFLLQALRQAERTGHYLLVVENLPLLLQSADPKVLTVLQRLLEARNISVVATTRTEEYHDVVRRSTAVESLFATLLLEEPKDEDVLAVMMERHFRLEHHLHVTVTYKALQAILTLARRYLVRGAFPGKALEVMTDAMAATRREGVPSVLEPHIRGIISQKSHVDVTEMKETERDRLLKIEETMRQQVIGQDAAVHAVASALKRARLDVGAGKRPLGTFLFLGPTGVGKTQTAKTLAEVYFGAADRMIRLDMNEFATAQGIEGILGSPQAGSAQAEGFLSRRIQDQPFSLILLDEIEKAHPSVINLFLQILDEGQLTDHHGIKTDFRNTIIIATSNAGALFLRDLVRKQPNLSPAAFKQTVVDAILAEKTFAPEFLNRFDEVVLFGPLSTQVAEQIAQGMVQDIVREMQEKRGITVQVGEDLVRSLVAQGYSPEFGARSLRRTITQSIENSLADYLLAHEVKRGEVIVLR